MDLVVESLADGKRGLAGDLAREGFSEEEVNIFLECMCTTSVTKSSSRPDHYFYLEVVRLVSDLLIAATDTTSLTATWVLYILSQHPHIQVR